MIKPNKFFLTLAILWTIAYFGNAAIASPKKQRALNQHDASWDLMLQQNKLEREASGLEEALQFELAKEKFVQAIGIGKRMTPRQDYWRPTFFYTRVLQKEGKYEEALREISQLCETAPENELFADMKVELEILIKARSLNSDSPIRQYIEDFKEKYAAGLPPKGTGDAIRMTTMLRLYDAIADYDAGIAYIDQSLKLLKIKKEKRNEDATVYDRIKTAQQAEECAALNKRPKDRDPQWAACKLIRNFLLVREGFEQDKAEGRVACFNSKPGEICLGRATKALIASDYFTW